MTAKNSRAVNSIIKEFSDQAKHPPGNDLYASACYQAMLQWQKLPLFINQVISVRHITPPHFVNLFLRAFQHEVLFGNKNKTVTYPDAYLDPKQWLSDLPDLIKNITLTMKNRETSTTIYQRYAGPFAILNSIFPSKTIDIVDFGCGGNYGLKGYFAQEPFDPIEDLTPHGQFTQWLKTPVKIKSGIALDKNNPQDIAELTWRLACSFYPAQTSKIPTMISLDERLSRINHITFKQVNLVKLKVTQGKPDLAPESKHGVIISTVLYQLASKDRDYVINAAKKLIRKTGVVIIQDFALLLTDRKLSFRGNWHHRPFSYRTFVYSDFTKSEFWEVFQWKNGRCGTVRPGADFDKFLKAICQLKEGR